MINPDQWLQDHYGAEIFRAGLSDLEKFLAPKLQFILQSKIKILTVAGTNGKGETSHRVGQLLESDQKGFKLWTSPHLKTVCERFISEKGQIHPESLVKLFETIEKRKTGKLSYYEFLFSVFVEWVSQDLPDYLILEVGMGGRLDATVLLPASVVLIPSISRDHQDYLGHRYEQILGEKLAIMDRCLDVDCVTSFELNYLREKTRERKIEKMRHTDLFSNGWLRKDDDFSTRNTTLAIYGHALLEGRVIDKNLLRQRVLKLQEKKIEGRGEEIVVNGKKITFFGSHNPDGVRKLVQLLRQGHYNFSEVLVSFSVRDQKDLITQLKLIGLLGKERVILTSFSHPKAASSDLLELLAKKEGIRFVKDWPQLLQSDKPSCLVTGSYYFVGAVQYYLSQFR